MMYYRIVSTFRDPDPLGVKTPPDSTIDPLPGKTDTAIQNRFRIYAKLLRPEGDSFRFACEFDSAQLTECAIVRAGTDPATLEAKLIRKFGLAVQDTTYEEITEEMLFELMQRAILKGLLSSKSKVTQHFRFSPAGKDRTLFTLTCNESVLDPAGDAEIRDEAEKTFFKDALMPELDRIQAGPEAAGVSGHPVHYMISGSDGDADEQVLRLLIRALWNKGRLPSRRHYLLYVGANDWCPESELDELYSSIEGGTVAIRVQGPQAPDSSYLSVDNDFIVTFGNVIRKYCHSVLTVFLLPDEDQRTRQRILEEAGNVCFVQMVEPHKNATESRRWLSRLAAEKGLSADEDLAAMVEEDRSYRETELKDLFDTWFSGYLRTKVYGQYAGFTAGALSVAKAEPKGCAYDELRDLIGIPQAKKIITQAVNFHKAGNLFRKKGLEGSPVSMHMVFTGNPGTAKTTVARLFARILKENGIVYGGQLVEVGRGDLVGKYVGWTAKAVQKCFEEAEGGVLFIDEAYSLADRYEGSFGDEAINTIVQEMENRRNDTIVIFAGYPDKMEEFLDKNPGLRSRIAFHVPFEDYSPDELCDITRLMARNGGLRITEEAMDKLKTIYEAACLRPGFGNGRFVRNMIERARIAQADRLLRSNVDAISSVDMQTIRAEDIEYVPERAASMTRPIGFCA